MIKYCVICGKEIEQGDRKDWDYRWKQTCSDECRNILKKKNQSISKEKNKDKKGWRELTLEEVQKEYLFSLQTLEIAAKKLDTTPSSLYLFCQKNKVKKDKALLYNKERILRAAENWSKKWQDESYRNKMSFRRTEGEIAKKHKKTYEEKDQKYREEILSLLEENPAFQFEDLANEVSFGKTTLRKIIQKYNIRLQRREKGEQEIEEFLLSHNISFERHNRNVLKREGKYPLELDFYVPEQKVAIEFNGLFWHSHSQISDKNYHFKKSQLCEEKGIRLIHIWQYEWENERQRPILENIILNACRCLDANKRIYARKCEIRVVKALSIKDFFLKNNIQGYRNANEAVCLYYENELIMAYSIGPSFLSKGAYDIEIARGATKLGYQVIGGASKLWKYITRVYMPSHNLKTCVYYIDFNYFNGNSLKNLEGLKFLRSQISFKNYWVREKKIKNREPKRNKEINELIKKGLVQVYYNAGTKTYVYGI